MEYFNLDILGIHWNYDTYISVVTVFSIITFLMIFILIAGGFYYLNKEWHKEDKKENQNTERNYFWEWFPKHPIISTILCSIIIWFLYNWILGLLCQLYLFLFHYFSNDEIILVLIQLGFAVVLFFYIGLFIKVFFNICGDALESYSKKKKEKDNIKK